MSSVQVTLLSKPGCHLCDDARVIVERVLADAPRTSLTERDITADPALFAQYAEEIPVVLIGGEVHAIWRVDEARFRSALQEATA